MFNIVDKIGFYIGKATTFSVLNIPFQVILSFCPSIFGYLSVMGWITFAAIFSLSLFHYRLFHIFFVLMLLKTDIPDEKNKLFWRGVVIFVGVVLLWGYLGFLSASNWSQLEELKPVVIK